MPTPPEPRPGDKAGAETSTARAAANAMCALLQQLRTNNKLSYDTLGQTPGLSRSTAANYITKPAHRRDVQTLELLLTALGASAQERAQVLQLHQQTQPEPVDPGETGWTGRARAVGCVVWPMSKFTAARAAVHTAIGRRRLPGVDDGPVGDMTVPAYVPRAHDPELRADIQQGATGDLRALVVVRGTSSTGKTRSLFEAVRLLCPGWTVIRPLDAVAARRLPQSGLLDRPVVVWLNELQGFLAPNGGGLSVHVLEDLYAAAAAPVVLVGTLWPSKLHTATDAHNDALSETRELLVEPWVRWHDVAPSLTTDAEWAAARKLARSDLRLAYAVTDPDRFGFAQTLAGARELLEHYNAPPTDPTRLLLDAAVDARRLGHTHALTSELLAAVTAALWREQHGAARPPRPDWFHTALAHATVPLRSDDGVRALIPLYTSDPDDLNPSGQGGLDGYGLADYLEQHLTRARAFRPVPDGVWDALRTHTTSPKDLTEVARSAQRYGRYRHAEATYRKAAAAGDLPAFTMLARWLSEKPGREADAEATWREAVAGGYRGALIELAKWLSKQPGREADAEATYREAVAADYPDALIELARWLSKQPGREADAEATYRKAVAAGEWGARLRLVEWLRSRPGRETDVETTYREMFAAGDWGAPRELAKWLSEQPGPEAEVEMTYREGIAAGDPFALGNLAEWLSWEPGREAEVETLWREAVAAAPDDVPEEIQRVHPDAMSKAQRLAELAEWLKWQPGREADVEATLREAAAAGDREALRHLAWWLRKQPGREADVEATWREAAAIGLYDALRELVEWLHDRPGREADVEATLREAVAAGYPAARRELVSWLSQQPGREADVEATLREAVAAGYPAARRELAKWLSQQPGREAEATYEKVETPHFDQGSVLRELAGWLSEQPGRQADAETTLREAAAAGRPEALSELTRWLRQQSGLQDEADRIHRFGIDVHGHTVEADDD